MNMYYYHVGDIVFCIERVGAVHVGDQGKIIAVDEFDHELPYYVHFDQANAHESTEIGHWMQADQIEIIDECEIPL